MYSPKYIKPHNNIVIEAGSNPAKIITTEDGYDCPLDWQNECYNYLADARYRLVLAPTGSGKSFIIRCLAWHDICIGNKVIIIIPETILRPSFYSSKFILPNGSKVNWNPYHFLFGIKSSTIEELYNFVKNPPGSTPASRTLICTHQTMTMALKSISNEKLSIDNISMFTDECHKVKTGDDANSLGKVVTYFIENGNLVTLSTATFMRGDHSKILTDDQTLKFKTYQLTPDRYLAMMVYLKEVVFSYVVATPEEAIRYLYQDSYRKGIVYMRHTSRMGGALDHDEKQERKLEKVDSYLGALGPSIFVSGDYVSHRQFSRDKTLRCVDLVTDNNIRDDIENEFLNEIKDGTGPDFVLAMSKATLGLNWKQCNFVGIDQKRDSWPSVLQMAGRALRDCQGKPRADIVTFIDPISKTDVDYASKIKEHLKLMLASMATIEWQFKTPDFFGITEKEKTAINKFRFDPKQPGKKILEQFVEDSIEKTVGKTPEEILKDIVYNALNGITSGTPDYEEEDKEPIIKFIKRQLKNKHKELLHDASEIPIDPAIEYSLTGAVECYSYTIHGGTELTDLRTRMEKPAYLDLQKEVIRRGIKTEKEYASQYKDIPNAPQHPNKVYNWEWQTWKHFVGLTTMPLRRHTSDVKKKIKEINGLYELSGDGKSVRPML